MRLLFDASAVQERGGGLTTYATGLLGGWSACFPDDELIVLAAEPGAARLLRAVTPDVRLARGIGARFAAQQALVPMQVRALKPTAVLSLVPGVPLIPLDVPILSVLHDLRSWMRPTEFSRWIRAYRQVAHHFAFHRSTRILAVSERSRNDLRRVCPRGAMKTDVVHPGADHVDGWVRDQRGPHVLTFGQWSNKKPDLALRAWAQATRGSRTARGWTLHVVGVPERQRAELVQAAGGLGVTGSVCVHGYLPADEYQRLFTSAAAVLMLTSFEGFGLPVIEAMRQGVHVIASRDPALQEAGGSSAVYVDNESGLSRALQAVMEDDRNVHSLVRAGLLRTKEMTWASTATAARSVIGRAISAKSVEVR